MVLQKSLNLKFGPQANFFFPQNLKNKHSFKSSTLLHSISLHSPHKILLTNLFTTVTSGVIWVIVRLLNTDVLTRGGIKAQDKNSGYASVFEKEEGAGENVTLTFLGSSDLNYNCWKQRSSKKERAVSRRFFFCSLECFYKRRWRASHKEKALAGGWSG